MENELRVYWTLMQEAFRLFRANPADVELDDIREEADVMLLHTEWPLLRAIIQKNLNTYEPEREAAKGLRPAVSAVSAVSAATLAMALVTVNNAEAAIRFVCG